MWSRASPMSPCSSNDLAHTTTILLSGKVGYGDNNTLLRSGCGSQHIRGLPRYIHARRPWKWQPALRASGRKCKSSTRNIPGPKRSVKSNGRGKPSKESNDEIKYWGIIARERGPGRCLCCHDRVLCSPLLTEICTFIRHVTEKAYVLYRMIGVGPLARIHCI
jgi:hypothetical protein